MCICLEADSGQRRKFPHLFTLQWHLTAQCDQHCKHCYMFDSPFYASERENELSFDACRKIIDDYCHTVEALKSQSCIFFSGGDPLLRKDFFDILQYAKEKGIQISGIIGNPYHVDPYTALKLKLGGISIYQISLDGLKNTHDFLRKNGSFDDSIRAYKVLKEAGISTACMFTVSKLNMHELIPVLNLANELGLDAFDFDRMVPTGSGGELKSEMIDSATYRELLTRVEMEYKRLKTSGSRMYCGRKDNLWNLVPHEDSTNGDILPSGYTVKHQCIIKNSSSFSILADGTVLACRRLPIAIGKLPEERLEDIMENSKELRKLKQFAQVEKCCKCDHFENCCGCRAIAYSFSGGDYFSKDPQCWHE